MVDKVIMDIQSRMSSEDKMCGAIVVLHVSRKSYLKTFSGLLDVAFGLMRIHTIDSIDLLILRQEEETRTLSQLFPESKS